MRRFIRLLVTVLMLAAAPLLTVAQQPAPKTQADPKAQTVFVTRTGKKYHLDGCQYLRRSRIPVTVKDAKANGYAACKVCRPPQ